MVACPGHSAAFALVPAAINQAELLWAEGCWDPVIADMKKEERRTGHSQKSLIRRELLGPRGSAAAAGEGIPPPDIGIMKPLCDDFVRLDSFCLRLVCNMRSRIDTMVASGLNHTLLGFF